MSNPILAALNSPQTATPSINPQVIQGFKQMMGMMKSAANPEALFNQMIASNPQVKSVMQMLNGRNPKDVFYERCKQMGADPEAIINQLRG